MNSNEVAQLLQEAIAAGTAMIAAEREKEATEKAHQEAAERKRMQEEWTPYLQIVSARLPAWSLPFVFSSTGKNLFALEGEEAPLEMAYRPSGSSDEVIINLPGCAPIGMALSKHSKTYLFYPYVRLGADDDGFSYVWMDSHFDTQSFEKAAGLAREAYVALEARRATEKEQEQARIAASKVKIAEREARDAEAKRLKEAQVQAREKLEKRRAIENERIAQGIPYDYLFEAEYALATNDLTRAQVFALLLVQDKLSIIANAL